MFSYRLKRKRNTDSKNPRVSKTSNGKIMFSSNCTVCNREKIKRHQRLLSQLGIRTNFSKIPFVDDNLFLV